MLGMLQTAHRFSPVRFSPERGWFRPYGRPYARG
jgi:hypothetical protein